MQFFSRRMIWLGVMCAGIATECVAVRAADPLATAQTSPGFRRSRSRHYTLANGL